MAATGANGNVPNNQAVIMDGRYGAQGASKNPTTPAQVATLGGSGGGTGALCTGIGYGMNSPIIGPTAPASIERAGFKDNTLLPLWRIGLPQTEFIGGFGNGAARDNNTGDIHQVKMVTAVGTVVNGAAVEAGFENRSNKTIVAGQSVHGYTTAVVDAG